MSKNVEGPQQRLSLGSKEKNVVCQIDRYGSLLGIRTHGLYEKVQRELMADLANFELSPADWEIELTDHRNREFEEVSASEGVWDNSMRLFDFPHVTLHS